MPDPFMHNVLGEEVLSSLNKEIKARINCGILSRALQGPDPWSTIGFYGGKYKKFANRSNAMHKQKTGAFFKCITEYAKQKSDDKLFSFLVGYICHYCLDKNLHPYIVYKGGEFNGSEETFCFRSGHVRLERGLDCFYIRQHYKIKPWHFSIPRKLFKINAYPKELKHDIDEIFLKVYGWDNSFELINRSLRDESLFWSIMEDPVGLVHYLLRPISRGKTDYCIYSFYRRDINSKELDYLNEKHSCWRHPFATENEYTESVFDLFDKAKTEAIEMIEGAYRYVYLKEDISLDKLYGNINYSTGLDCDDKRNNNLPICDAFIYQNRYF